MDLRLLFEQLHEENAAREKHFSIRSQWLSWVRTGFFLAWAYAFYVALQIQDKGFLTAVVVIGLILFVILVQYHRSIGHQRVFYKRKKDFCHEEIRGMEGDILSREDGARFRDRSHPYAEDLDLFGPLSLFHHLNRCQLGVSRKLLAGYLTAPSEKTDAMARQQAIRELAEDLDWMLGFRASIQGDRTTNSAFPSFKRISFALTVTGYVLGTFSAFVLSAYFLLNLPVGYVMVMAFIHMIILFFFQKKAQQAGWGWSHAYQGLQSYLSAIRWMRRLRSNSLRLQQLQECVGDQAVKEMRQLGQLVHLLDSRANMVYVILNVFFLLDIHILYRLGRWHARNRGAFVQWQGAVHEMEVLVSFAFYTRVHPEFHFPELDEKSRQFCANGLGHPLIRKEARVTNDFVKNVEKLVLITGSNMSGKSTFLRSVGINMVMAWAGLPVCARSFSCGRFSLYTGMRTQDNIKESTSSFYAELKRIRGMLDLMETSPFPVFYLLDELLRGTNSADRHMGSLGLIRRLKEGTAYGFVSTHDLELSGELEGDGQIGNYSFNSRLENDILHFDYLLTQGKCQSTNAFDLMRIMGILR